MGAIDCSIDHLLLDSENPRNKSTANQRDALQKVLDDQEEKLFVLAEDIVEAGLSPMDRMLVLREKMDSERFIVLEGNLGCCWFQRHRVRCMKKLEVAYGATQVYGRV